LAITIDDALDNPAASPGEGGRAASPDGRSSRPVARRRARPVSDAPITTLPRPVRLTRLRRISVYLVGAGLWLTGALWLLFHYVVGGGDGFAVSRNPLEPWWLTLHGGFGFASLWLLGLLWGVHIGAGWSSGQRRWSGGVTLGALVCLIVTGYLLYYLGDDRLRAGTSVLHWALGLALPVAFLAHRLARSRAGATVVDGSGQPCGFALESATLPPVGRGAEPAGPPPAMPSGPAPVTSERS